MHGVASVLGTRLTVLFLGVGSTVALARGLGPDGRGTYALAMTAATIGLVVVNFGFNTANTYFASREAALLPSLVSNTFGLAGTVGVLGLSLLGLTHAVGIRIIPIPSVLLLLVVAWLPLGMVFIQLQSLLLSLGNIRQFNVAEAGWQLLSVVCVVGLWITKALTPVTAFAVVLMSLTAGGFYVFVQLYGTWSLLPKPSPSLFARMLPFAARSWAISIAAIALVRLDVFLVASELGIREVGFYAVAVTICEVIMILPATIGGLLLPRLTAMLSDAERWEATRRVMAVTLVLLLIVCVLAAAAARPGIGLLFGPAYLPSTTPLYWLLPGVLLLGLNTVLVQHFLAVGMPKGVLVGQALAVGFNLGLAFVLLRPLGLAGAGLASSIAYSGALAVTAGYAVRWGRIGRMKIESI